MTAPRVLVFGGSGVVGHEVVTQLAAAGAQVAFTYLTSEDRALALAKATPGSLALPLDLSSVEDIGSTVRHVHERLEGIDAFVHCAAVGVTVGDQGHPPLAEIDEAGWDRMQAVNTKSAFFAVQALAPLMSLAGGNVVLVGSIDGIKPVPAPVHYATSKGALTAMARTLAKELGPQIRVNLVAPGILDDGISRTLPQALKDEYLKHSGLRRFGTAAEVAGLVTWLALNNTYLTGQSMVLDGAL